MEETLISMWRQALVGGVEKIKLNGRLFPLRRTPRRSACVKWNFDLDGEAVLGLEQNPETSFRWVQLARQGHRIMQFLSEGRYIANVVDDKVTFYG